MSRNLLFGLFASILFVAGCDRRGPVAPSQPPVNKPSPSSPSPTPPPSSVANWRADATVVAVTPGGRGSCGWGTAPGETRAGVGWRITIDGDSISADEDMNNWPTDDTPFAGRVSGRQFSAAYTSGADYLSSVCQFRGGTLSGTFNADFSTFEATETLVWGPPGADTTVQRRWVGSRL